MALINYFVFILLLLLLVTTLLVTKLLSISYNKHQAPPFSTLQKQSVALQQAKSWYNADVHLIYSYKIRDTSIKLK
jgi:hypothetical protein